MKIIEILEDSAPEEPTSPSTTSTSIAKPTGSNTPQTVTTVGQRPPAKHQDLQALWQADPKNAVQAWGQKRNELQQRCNAMLARLIKAAGLRFAGQLHGTTVAVVSSTHYLSATPIQRIVNIDLSVFWDAPDATLAVGIGHELGHIALGHINGYKDQEPSQSRQNETNADDFGIKLAKLLGYDTAELFRFMHNKREYDRINAKSSKPDSTHPNYDQRIERAKEQGFKLSKGGEQQIDALLQHLA